MATRKKVTEYAAKHNLTIDFNYWIAYGSRNYQFSVDLPDGMITESGNTGKYSEEEFSDHTAAQIWDYILGDVKALIAENWITLQEHDAITLAEQQARQAAV